MIDTIYKKFALVVGLGLTLGLANVGAVAAPPVNPLAGTWEILGNPEPTCGVLPFVNLGVISQDGSLVNVDPEVGAAVGETYRIGPGQFGAGFFGFINDQGTILRYEVQGTLTLIDASQLTGVFSATIFDPTGNPLCSYDGTLEGNRLVAQAR